MPHSAGLPAMLTSVQVGMPRNYGFEDAADTHDKPWTTGFFKVPVDGPIFVGTTTIPGICEFILYTRNPDSVQQKFDNDLLARVFTHKVHIKIQPDKDWNHYSKLL